ncbi:ABC transporter permease subunit [Streptomyces sp. ID05-47C]|uniref:ABC transporter permease subunit n=1 Tax=Streptomyces sp. ID05-47C TaxID=3028665 RepID=UPI0029A7416A|nr:ABC transporter permease subunit [Streptomyces sp. ID05-47C]MDX3575191.1 ABC transporter permease subunit [Streptomyces sp. ID05-47C]
MTAAPTARVTQEARKAEAAPAVRWGVARTVLRLHRAALIVWGLAVLGLTGWLVWLTEVTADETRAKQEACHRAGLHVCNTDVGLFGYSAPMDAIATLAAHSFIVVAAFAGGALIGRELENGTARLAWSQGITPARWLTAKLACPALAVTVGVTVLVLVFRWAWEPNRVLIGTDWMGDSVFALLGPAAVAYALCALALGTLTALLLRRTLPALAVSAALTWLLSLILVHARASLWPALTRTSATEYVYSPHRAWDLSQGPLVHGSPAPQVNHWACNGTAGKRQRCLDDLGVTGYYSTYHPRSHFWPLHLVETGILLAVAAAAVAVSFRLVRHRTA